MDIFYENPDLGAHVEHNDSTKVQDIVKESVISWEIRTLEVFQWISIQREEFETTLVWVGKSSAQICFGNLLVWFGFAVFCMGFF